MDSWAGKTAVITGAGSGLGAAMAGVIADEGSNIVALDIDAPRAADTAATMHAKGVDAISAHVDVADGHSVRAAAAVTDERFGGCDFVCANVGVQQFGALDRLTEQDWSWVLSVNVMGVVHTVSAFLPLVRKRTGERHVVVTSSSSFFDPGVRLGAYTTSKYAVVGYGETLRRELEPEGIGVTVLFPAGMSSRHLESSALARPEALGESVTLPDDIDAMIASRKWDAADGLATPEHAVRNLVRDLRDNRPYVITHGGYRDAVAAYQREVLEAYDRR
jgi:NAD(P)-dependent dehydrogenase (short-subunit alcohol dehydrogenase family)